MAEHKAKNPADYIMPLYMNKLQGRMLRMPAPKGRKREILFVYGHHSSLERWWGVVQDLNQYGAVTMPDLPGFGGMDSFYRIGDRPTIDNLADYLAAFVKLHYRRKKVTIAGLSLGFVIVTRMLQRFPELTRNVDMLVSVVGFTHKDDFTLSPFQHSLYYHSAKFFSGKLRSKFFRRVCLHSLPLRIIYKRTLRAKQKYGSLTTEERRKIMDFETYLWHCNDARTWLFTSTEFLNLNNCEKQIDLPVWHVSVADDRYFDKHVVEQHMRVVFSDFHEAQSGLATHAPSIIADVETAAPLLPQELRDILSKDS